MTGLLARMLERCLPASAPFSPLTETLLQAEQKEENV